MTRSSEVVTINIMKDYQRGQILLIVVLVMTIALTIGLSVATRTITNLRTSTEDETSQRAFSAAEAGMEKALQLSSGNTGSLTNNSSYATNITPVSGQDILLNNGSPVLKDSPADVWLSTYPGYTAPWSGNITVYWGGTTDACNRNETANTMAALEIILLSGTKANPVVTHYPVDPCNARRTGAAGNGFPAVAAGGGTVQGKAFRFKTSLVVASGLLMRIVPLYSSSFIGVRSCNALGAGCSLLPSQGTLVSAVGTSSNTQTKIVAMKNYPTIPFQVFPYVIFSP